MSTRFKTYARLCFITTVSTIIFYQIFKIVIIQDGTQLIFFIDYGTGQTDEVKVESTAFGNLADGEFHDVYIIRNGNTTIVQVDDLELPPLRMRGVTTILPRGAMYLSGGPNPSLLTNNKVRQNLDATILNVSVDLHRNETFHLVLCP